MMDRVLCVIIVLIHLTFLDAWQRDTYVEDKGPNRRGTYHYHSKRQSPNGNPSRRRLPVTTQKTRELRKKPSGHLTPLNEDDMDDEVMSVAIGPPPIRPKFAFEKATKKPNIVENVSRQNAAINLVRDVLAQIAKDFITHQVNEDFVFGQYIGNAMRNMTGDLRLRMQHEILDLILKYQKLNKPDKWDPRDIKTDAKSVDLKMEKKFNDTDDQWPDFNNLAKLMG